MEIYVTQKDIWSGSMYHPQNTVLSDLSDGHIVLQLIKLEIVN